MSQHTIDVSGRFTLVSHVEDLGIKNLNLDGFNQCNLRLSDCTFAEPLPLMLLAVQFRQLVKRYPNVNYRLLTKPSQFRGYAEHVGFFQFLGFQRGNSPGEAFGSSTYVPIEIIDINEFIAINSNLPLGESVLPISRRLAELLSRSNEGPLYNLFEYSFREIIRNSIEHSGASKLAFFGQFWPMRNSAEIVVMDSGVGIANSLYDNEYIECNTNREALNFALMPGISGVPLEVRANQDEKWGNSGFGLYVTSRLCSEQGSFRVLSGSSSLTLARGVRTEHDWSFNGTCIQLKFSTNAAEMIERRLNEIIEQGKAEWLQIIGDYPINASAASQMLSSHFDRN